MEKKVRSTLIILVLYAVIFWIGFCAGEAYHRMKNGYTAERIAVPMP